MHAGSQSEQPPVARSPSVVVVIPARYESSRFPGKALADIAGRSMVEHVYRRAACASRVASVIVATDDVRIRDAVLAFGGAVQMTSPAHASGTDRLGEVARDLACDLVVNVQGDEPLVEPAMIDQAITAFDGGSTVALSTLCSRLTDPADAANPNVVKVVVDRDGYALYFSRAAIPYRSPQARLDAPALRHIGLYVYRRDVLLTLASLEPTPLERLERLEQLRALEYGFRIKTLLTSYAPVGVDTPEDLERVRRILVTKRRLEPTSAGTGGGPSLLHTHAVQARLAGVDS